MEAMKKKFAKSSVSIAIFEVVPKFIYINMMWPMFTLNVCFGFVPIKYGFK